MNICHVNPSVVFSAHSNVSKHAAMGILQGGRSMLIHYLSTPVLGERYGRRRLHAYKLLHALFD